MALSGAGVQNENPLEAVLRQVVLLMRRGYYFEFRNFVDSTEGLFVSGKHLLYRSDVIAQLH